MQGNYADQVSVFSDNGRRQRRLELLFFQFGKVAETGIIHGRFLNDHRLEMHANPASDTLSQGHFDFAYKVSILFIDAGKHKALCLFIVKLEGCSMSRKVLNDNIEKM